MTNKSSSEIVRELRELEKDGSLGELLESMSLGQNATNREFVVALRNSNSRLLDALERAEKLLTEAEDGFCLCGEFCYQMEPSERPDNKCRDVTKWLADYHGEELAKDEE